VDCLVGGLDTGFVVQIQSRYGRSGASGEKIFPTYSVRGWAIFFIVFSNFVILRIGKADWMSTNAALRFFLDEAAA